MTIKMCLWFQGGVSDQTISEKKKLLSAVTSWSLPVRYRKSKNQKSYPGTDTASKL